MSLHAAAVSGVPYREWLQSSIQPVNWSTVDLKCPRMSPGAGPDRWVTITMITDCDWWQSQLAEPVNPAGLSTIALTDLGSTYRATTSSRHRRQTPHASWGLDDWSHTVCYDKRCDNTGLFWTSGTKACSKHSTESGLHTCCRDSQSGRQMSIAVLSAL